MVPKYVPSWLRAHYVNQAGFQLIETDCPFSSPWLLLLKAYTTIPGN